MTFKSWGSSENGDQTILVLAGPTAHSMLLTNNGDAGVEHRVRHHEGRWFESSPLDQIKEK